MMDCRKPVERYGRAPWGPLIHCCLKGSFSAQAGGTRNYHTEVTQMYYVEFATVVGAEWEWGQLGQLLPQNSRFPSLFKSKSGGDNRGNQSSARPQEAFGNANHLRF